MSRSSNNNKKAQRHREPIEVDPPDQNILDSIGDSNAWTPEKEDAWLEELNKIPSVEIYKRYPPMKKPGNVSRRGKTHGG